MRVCAFLLVVLGFTAMNGMAEEVVPMVLKPFPLQDVRLLEGPCRDGQEANRRYLHDLEVDRLLYTFRKTAGLDAPGEPLGGWEKPDCEVRGHFVGHYLSACALMYVSAGDEALKEKAGKMVAEFARCQEALGGDYLSAYPESFWDRLEAMEKPPWAPYYTMHKIMAGLFDVYALCGNEQALDVLEGMVRYFKGRIDKIPGHQWDKILGVEFGGVAELGYNLYAVTGKPEHLEFAHLFDKAAFLGPLALEHDNLTGLHANTHIPEIAGAARRYELLGDGRYRTVVEYFWEQVAKARTYATGGTSNAEHWGEPCTLSGTLSDQNQESCTSYNMLKVTRHLLCWTGRAEYADYYERVYFNSILGTQDPRSGMLAYFTPLQPVHAKKFGTPNDSFWCCYGTGIESFSKLGDSVYFHDEDGLYVNLFVASEVHWRERGVRIEQRTAFPQEEGTTLTVHAEQPVTFTMNIHVPYWAGQGVEVMVNGEPVEVSAEATSYAALTRAWSDGDRVSVRMPMALHMSALPGDERVVAAMYGPLVLAGLSDEVRYLTAAAPLAGDWLAKSDAEPLTFTTRGQDPEMVFVPLNGILDESYGVYWEFVEEGSERHKAILEAEAKEKALAARTIDRVVVGDGASEKAHGLEGERTQAGAFSGRHWRHAADGGWWQWQLKVTSGEPAVLQCTYWGSDGGKRTFDVLVDGEKVATQTLANDRPGAFFDVDYALPAAMTQGKEKVSVMFKAHEGCFAGGVFDCRVLKSE